MSADRQSFEISGVIWISYEFVLDGVRQNSNRRRDYIGGPMPCPNLRFDVEEVVKLVPEPTAKGSDTLPHFAF